MVELIVIQVLHNNSNFDLLVSKCRGVTPARDNTRPADSQSLWDDMKDEYKKENPEVNLMGDKFINPNSNKSKLKMPPKDYILPLPKPWNEKMTKKPLNISESAAVQMPMKTVASLILLVAAGVFAYTELTARLVSLETSRELFQNDLLKKSEQVPRRSRTNIFN